ncbi:MAG TPA: hypothetical protein VGQ26_05825, partial [Streptosporangiaceae bacterium]|nr:hypothetical protein [Streptosporangiaceae bacterium]
MAILFHAWSSRIDHFSAFISDSRVRNSSLYAARAVGEGMERPQWLAPGPDCERASSNEVCV